MRRLLPAMLLVAAATVLATGCGGSSSGSSASGTTTTADTTTATTGGTASGTLNGSVGPGFDISMKQKTVPAGTYKLVVDDQGTIHNFRFSGPGGVDVKTDVAGTGIKTFTVTLQKGTYTFVCDPHSSSMHGTLTVS